MSLYRVVQKDGKWVIIGEHGDIFAVCATEHSATQTAQSLNALMGDWKPLIRPNKERVYESRTE